MTETRIALTVGLGFLTMGLWEWFGHGAALSVLGFLIVLTTFFRVLVKEGLDQRIDKALSKACKVGLCDRCPMAPLVDSYTREKVTELVGEDDLAAFAAWKLQQGEGQKRRQ